MIWVGAILPLQIAKSAVERQPLIGHGFFGELNLLNSEMPLIAGKAILPYQRVQADAFSNKTRFYEYIADHSARDALVSFPEQGVFSEARVYTRLGLYYSWQDGGSAYYSSEAFAKGWLHRREVNNRFFAAESPPDQIQPAALEMWNAGVRWVIASERMDGRDQYLTLAYHDGDLWAYGFALPASP